MKSEYLHFILDHTVGGLEIHLPLWHQLTACLVSSFTSTGLGVISYLPRLLFPSQLLKIRNCLVSSFSVFITSPLLFWDVIKNRGNSTVRVMVSGCLKSWEEIINLHACYFILRFPAQAWELGTYCISSKSNRNSSIILWLQKLGLYTSNLGLNLGV